MGLGVAPLPQASSAAGRARLIISLPGLPNPPAFYAGAGQLYRGKARWLGRDGRPEPVEPVQALTETSLRCGQKQFEWRGLDSDHGNEMVLEDTAFARRALQCFAAHLPFDFYVRREAGPNDR
jgi:hypothetical protein